ncbi:MAG: hypothetical protein H7338_12345 [Candidatus Sericytochromatia bacterium]|nr:hypothetical protein [Candidatus Sericytochromatia bacterium]
MLLSKHVPLSLLIGLFAIACLPITNGRQLSATTGGNSPFRTMATAPSRYTAFPAVSGQPEDFRDATTDVAPGPDWLFPGDWSLFPSLAGFSGGVFHQEETGAFPHVTIRRYAGATFGTDGALPAHYTISLAVQPFAMADHMPPIGENGVLVYYKNPTNYVELVISGGNVAVWSANNAGPTSDAGWTGHYWFGQTTATGDIRRLSAEIDTVTHQLTYWVEGRKAATLTIPMLTETAPHTFALRSIGNKINFGEIVVDDLTGGTNPSPTPPPSASPTPIPAPSISPTATPTVSPTVTPGGPLTFQDSGTLPKAAAWNRAIVKGTHLYVSGGTNGSQSFTDVWSSPIQQPLAWQARTALPLPTEGHGFAVLGNYAYVVGGWGRGSAPRASVYRALINADGSLDSWQATTPLPQGRAFHGLVVDNDRLVVIEGWNPGYAATTTVWTATADANGALSAWQSGPILPERRMWAGTCIADGKLLVIGGSNGSAAQSTVYQATYTNGQIGAWQVGPPLPKLMLGQACVSVAGTATTLGGSNATDTFSDVYQLINGTWTVSNALAGSRFGMASAATASQVYLLGGQNAGQGILGSVLAAAIGGPPSPTPTPTPVPPPTLTPTPLPSPTPTPVPTATPATGQRFQVSGNLPQAAVWAGAAVKGTTLYVSGGTNGSQSFTDVWSSPIQQPWVWQARTALPVPTEGHGFAVVGNYTYVVGGWGRGSAPRATVYRALINADGSLGSWQTTTPLPQGRAFHRLVVDNDRLVVIGGWNPGYAATTTVWTATVDASGNVSAWLAGPDLPERRVRAGACYADGTLFVTGGSDGSQTKATVFQASYNTGQIGNWTLGPALPGPIEGHACLTQNGQVTTLGGDNYVGGNLFPTNAVQQLVNGSWSQVSQLPAARFAQACAPAGGLIYLLGGHDAAHNVLAAIWQGAP